MLKFVTNLYGSDSWLCKHVVTDWLAACWFSLIAAMMWFLGSWLLCFSATNDRQIYVWVTSAVDAFLFSLGSAYYVAGNTAYL